MRSFDVSYELPNVAIQSHVLGVLQLLLRVDKPRDNHFEDRSDDLTLGIPRQTRSKIGGISALAASCFIISANIRNQGFYTRRSFMI